MKETTGLQRLMSLEGMEAFDTYANPSYFLYPGSNQPPSRQCHGLVVAKVLSLYAISLLPYPEGKSEPFPFFFSLLLLLVLFHFHIAGNL